MLKLIAAVAYIAIGIVLGWGFALAAIGVHLALALLVAFFQGERK